MSDLMEESWARHFLMVAVDTEGPLTSRGRVMRVAASLARAAEQEVSPAMFSSMFWVQIDAGYLFEQEGLVSLGSRPWALPRG